MLSFPITFSPSPVNEAFHGIHLDPLSKLDLTGPEISLLRAAEENVLEYTLASQEDAELYIHALLKVLDQCITRSNPNSPVSKLPLDELLSEEDAVQLLYDDPTGVMTHYAVSRLGDAVLSLRSVSKAAKVTLSSTFYPDGIQVEQCQIFLRLLLEGGSDAYAQRK